MSWWGKCLLCTFSIGMIFVGNLVCFKEVPRIGKCLEHLEMLILEVHPFLVDPPPLWDKLKIHKVGLITGYITYRAKHTSP